MYYIISAFTGILIAIMLIANGGLSSQYGLYSSTVMIHIVGFIFTLVVMAVKKEKGLFKQKLPLHLYLGGAIGVLTVLFNNQAFGKISVSSILALNLLGQSITSIVIDQFGLLNMPKQPLRLKKLIGISVIFCGILWMSMPLETKTLFPILLSLLSGFTIVVSRTLNGGLALATSDLKSTWFNYFIGLIVSTSVLLIWGQNEPLFTSFHPSRELFLYCGGLLGVAVIVLSNIAVTKISAFYMTLFLFIGQMSTGIISDFILTQSFSFKNLAGGICVAVGLSLNLWFENSMPYRTQ